MPKTTHDSETLAHRQQVITACAFIHHNFSGTKKVFSAKRADTKKFMPGRWELPGGHIDYGEDIIDGLKREIKEEFGMDITVADPLAVFTYINDVKKSHSIEVIYFARFTSDLKNITPNPEDHSEHGWFDEQEALEVIAQSKPADDPEIAAVKKGFKLLRGESLLF